MRVAMMIEGQEDVTWEDWLGVARACEESGLDGLFRSDHYGPLMGHSERGSLDAWTTLAAVAAVTERIRLGTMVSPVTFRHPSALAKSVVTVDHVSGGRIELGIGAGWNEPEHRAFGFPFPDTGTRMEMLAEQLEIIHRSWGREPFDFRGNHYTIEGLDAHPKPLQLPHPPVVMGGLAGPRVAALAARWADEYNTTFPTLDEAPRRRARLAAACEEVGRDPSTLGFSIMTGCVVGRDEADLRRRAAAVMERIGATGGSEDAWLSSMSERWIVGTVAQVVDRIGEYEKTGVQRVLLQHQAHVDLDMIRLVGAEVVPAVA
jgi:F420-dependent oxidoreductase-like protein